MNKKNILIGISGGIAAYKIIDLIKLLQKEKINVSVVLTHSASKLVDIQKLERLIKKKAYVELFENKINHKAILKSRSINHINLADNNDLFIIAPATANIIGKLANGIADDYLTTIALAFTKPLLICPSMNVHMWNNPVLRENIDKLKRFGHHIIEPTEGELACGYVGQGRLEDVNIIKEEIINRLYDSTILKDKRIIVTAGGTSEPIDSVRSITNKSSGKMGVAIAESCALKGAEVILLRAKSSVKPRFIIKEEIFETTSDLRKLVKKYAEEADIFFHVAAVSDFTVEEKISGKVSSKNGLKLNLIPTEKIYDEIKKINKNLYLILFKAGYDLNDSEILKIVDEKIEQANADAIVANDISRSDRGFEADKNEVTVVLRNGLYKKFTLKNKRDIAHQLIYYLIKDMEQISSPTK